MVDFFVADPTSNKDNKNEATPDFDDVFDTMSIAADDNEFLEESFTERPSKRKAPMYVSFCFPFNKLSF